MGEVSESKSLCVEVLDSNMLLHFEARARKRRPGSKIEIKFRIFTTLKFRGGGSEMFESVLQVHPSRPLIYTFDGRCSAVLLQSACQKCSTANIHQFRLLRAANNPILSQRITDLIKIKSV